MTEVNEPRGAELIPASQAAHPARDPNSSHISELQSRVATDLGMLAAHGAEDEARWCLELCLRAWCKTQPGLRGRSVDFLCWLYDKTREREEERCDIAAYRVQRAVWPMFTKHASHASRQRIIAAAKAANGGVLSKRELDAELRWICARATAKPHRKAA